MLTRKIASALSALTGDMMNLSGSMMAVVVGFGLLQAGCADSAGGGDAPEFAPSHVKATGYNGSEPTGTTGSNGLPISYFKNNRANINMALSLPFLVKGAVNPDIIDLFAKTEGGPETLKYVVGCAGPVGQCINYGAKECATGGMLASTKPWLSAGMPVTALGPRGDLLACMATHVNAYSVEVDIRLSGKNVNNSASAEEAGTFDFQEALWAADPPSFASGPLTYHVWPLDDLERYCGESVTNESLTMRYCGHAKCTENFSFHSAEKECTADKNGNMTCNGRSVIKSWLRATDVSQLYPRCALAQPPPQ